MLGKRTRTGSVRRAFLCTVASFLCSIGSAFGQQPLSEEELREDIAGKTLLWSRGSTMAFQADGQFVLSARNGRTATGKWTLSGNELCHLQDSGARACSQFYKDAEGTYSATSSGRKFRLASADKIGPITGILTECEQHRHFAIQPPAADVPANTRTFSGTWIGTWDNGLCAAVVIENVSSLGTARLLYVNGTLPREGIRAGSSRFDGTIVGSTIVAKRAAFTLQLTIHGTTELNGRFLSSYGQASAVFVRK